MQQPQKDVVERGYQAAVEAVKAALRKLSSPEATTIDSAMSKAKTEDEERMKAYQDRCANVCSFPLIGPLLTIAAGSVDAAEHQNGSRDDQ